MYSSRFCPGVLSLLAGVFLLLLASGTAHASIRLTLQPQVLVADGRSTATVTVEVPRVAPKCAP